MKMILISPSQTPETGRSILGPRFKNCALLLSTLLSLASAAHSATFTLSGSDAASTSSFNTQGLWSPSGFGAPSAGNDYVVSARTMRTPQDSNSVSFAGNSLTLNNGSNLLIKETAATTITLSNFILNNATLNNSASSGFTTTLAGGITLQSGGVVLTSTFTSPVAAAYTTKVTSTISGSGALTMRTAFTGTPNASARFCTQLGGVNTYSGGTTAGSQNGQLFTLEVHSGSSLGAGDVNLLGYVSNRNTLTLNSPTSIADAATLTLGDSTNTQWTLNLNYSGSETIGSLICNGATYGNGTYGGAGSGASVILPGIAGAGTLTVVPEPGGLKLILAAGVWGLLIRRRTTRLSGPII